MRRTGRRHDAALFMENELLTHHAATSTPTSPARRGPPTTSPRPNPATSSTYSPPPIQPTPTSTSRRRPYDYPYGYSDDTLADLAFTDLPRQRPTLAPTNIDIDLGALRARREADYTHAAALAEAILSRCAGPPAPQPPRSCRDQREAVELSASSIQ
jgi:hypothetical protein